MDLFKKEKLCVKFMEQYGYTEETENRDAISNAFCVGYDVATIEIKTLRENIEQLKKDLFVLSSDVVFCGCGHVTAGLSEKAKRMYEKLINT